MILQATSREPCCVNPSALHPTQTSSLPQSYGGRELLALGLIGPLPLFLQCVTWSWILSVCTLSCVRLLATPWTVAHQASLSMGFPPGQEYWSRLPCPPPGDLPNPGIEPRSPALQVDSLPSEPPGTLLIKLHQGKLYFSPPLSVFLKLDV